MHTINPAGGNFWRGARQGLITAGLNHLVHRVQNGFKERKWLRRQLDDIYSRKRQNESLLSLDEAGREAIVLELMGRVKELRYLEGLRNDGKLSIDVTMKNKGFALADTSEVGGLTANTSKVQIRFYNKAFKNLFRVAYTIHHEGIHAQHFLNGKLYQWYVSAWNKTQNANTAAKYAEYISEYYAYFSTFDATGINPYLVKSNSNLVKANNICSTCLR